MKEIRIPSDVSHFYDQFKFYDVLIDECVPQNQGLAKHLKNKSGLESIVINEEPLKGAPDVELRVMAQLYQTVIITCDQGFRDYMDVFNEENERVYYYIYFSKKRPKSWKTIRKEVKSLISERKKNEFIDYCVKFKTFFQNRSMNDGSTK